jgi:hypothetical protein
VLVSFVRLIGCVRALRADARAKPWDETTDETITHGDGSSVAGARHRPRLTWTTSSALYSRGTILP